MTTYVAGPLDTIWDTNEVLYLLHYYAAMIRREWRNR